MGLFPDALAGSRVTTSTGVYGRRAPVDRTVANGRAGGVSTRRRKPGLRPADVPFRSPLSRKREETPRARLAQARLDIGRPGLHICSKPKTVARIPIGPDCDGSYGKYALHCNWGFRRAAAGKSKGAENGAKAFGAWAKILGIPTEILTDEEHPVSIDEVKSAFGRLFAGRPAISRLLVYFAGHGLARDAAEDLWLLSQWRTTGRAVAVGGLNRRIARYAVAQLTIVSDACRSPAAGADSADLVADPVLDLGPFDPRIPLLEMWRASSPFHAAYMVRGSKPEDDRCIFSGLLNEALSGAHEVAFEAPDRVRITNFSLAKFLVGEVPLRAGDYGVKLEPHIATGFWPPENVYLESRPATPPALAPWPKGSVDAMSAAETGSVSRRGWSTASGEQPAPPAANERRFHKGPGGEKPLFEQDAVNLALQRRQQDNQARRYLNDYASEGARPTHFETGSGFNIASADATQATLGRLATAVRDQVSSWWRVVPSDRAISPRRRRC